MNNSPPPAASSVPMTEQRSYPAALSVVTAVFFIWGFLTSLNDILIPHLKSLFSLNYAQAMLVQSCFFGAYFIMSLPAGKLVSKLGYKGGIVAGLLVAGMGALGFVPAAQGHSYYTFLAALFILASGITVLQVAANPYVTLLGPERTASSRINLAQALNALGTTLGPHFGGLLILSAATLSATQLAGLPSAQQLAYRAQQAHAVQGPYIGLAITLFVLAVIFWLLKMPSLINATEQGDERQHGIREVLAKPHVLFGVLGIFAYCGAEVSVSSTMVNYLSMPEIGGMTEQQAANWVSYFWGGAMIGRLVGSSLMLRFNPGKLVGLFALVNVLLLATTINSHGMIATISVVAIGLFNSIMFPTIFSLGIAKLGSMTSKASALLIMAIVGAAVIPYLQGRLSDHIGVQDAFILPLLCYLYIAFYGFKGSRVK
ncbi:glucose/galactose transporter [Frateuria aurantia DSM 6220]|uniref:Glucose/galactose transporter n=2 Tax=Frateuria aurantia TaxID=81475 RepID=H8L1X9_FRAAD|nr:glucose/galactose transporter [Frateuria aurantia DSM 6220]